jgi:rhodanese-related sulfurtransferase
MKVLLAVALGLVVLGGIAAAPADDAEVPERYIHVEQARALMDQPARVLFIDVRPSPQFRELHIRGAINIPVSEIATRLSRVPKNVQVVLY